VPGEHVSDVFGCPVELALLQVGDGGPDPYLGPGARYLRFACCPALIGILGCPERAVRITGPQQY
jgi:hypothetical protein